jgi:mannose-6-phosphate isomerase-like protein (cupin superfamily)
MGSVVTADTMASRLVRYADLRPCTTAFIDTRTPGSEKKENFTIIGPGVAENPDQHVHIKILHGFNIGGARQPPRCINSQHSHETAEVFVIHSGRWRFKTGHDGADAYVDLSAGDTISIPVHVFRGFENIGSETAFMFAVLGGDDPGHVTWAPYVFAAAAQHGLVLLESGRLIDTQREDVPAGAALMRPTTMDDVAKFRSVTTAELEGCVGRADELQATGGLSDWAGFAECAVVGVANPAEGMPAGKMGWSHNFQLRALTIAGGAFSPRHRRHEEEVLLVHAGHTILEWDDGRLEVGPGDTLTVPKGLVRQYRNEGSEPARIYVVRGGDHPAAAELA